MKKADGMNFSVRFFRRGIVKSTAREQKPQEAPLKGDVVNDIPEQAMQEPITSPVFAPVSAAVNVQSPADAAKEKMLRDAAKAGDCYTIRVLVMEGIDLDARDEQGRTALNIATQYNRRDAIKTLLAAREMRRMAKLGELPETKFFQKFKTKTK